jgi:hypothetical protein
MHQDKAKAPRLIAGARPMSIVPKPSTNSSLPADTLGGGFSRNSVMLADVSEILGHATRDYRQVVSQRH